MNLFWYIYIYARPDGSENHWTDHHLFCLTYYLKYYKINRFGPPMKLSTKIQLVYPPFGWAHISDPLEDSGSQFLCIKTSSGGFNRGQFLAKRPKWTMSVVIFGFSPSPSAVLRRASPCRRPGAPTEALNWEWLSFPAICRFGLQAWPCAEPQQFDRQQFDTVVFCCFRNVIHTPQMAGVGKNFPRNLPYFRKIQGWWNMMKFAKDDDFNWWFDGDS